MKCPKCGGETSPDHTYCEHCGAALGGHGVNGRPGSGEFRYLPGTSIVLSQGEVVWRAYHVSQLRTWEQGLGTLYVTDRRIVLYVRVQGRGTKRPNVLVQETRLEQITGLSGYVSRRFSFHWILGWLLVALGLGESLLTGFQPGMVFFGLLAILAVVAFARGAGRLGIVGIRLQSASTSINQLNFGRFQDSRTFLDRWTPRWIGSLLSGGGFNSVFDVVLDGYPAEDAEHAVAEMGALIMDLQRARPKPPGPPWVPGGVPGGVPGDVPGGAPTQSKPPTPSGGPVPVDS